MAGMEVLEQGALSGSQGDGFNRTSLRLQALQMCTRKVLHQHLLVHFLMLRVLEIAEEARGKAHSSLEILGR